MNKQTNTEHDEEILQVKRSYLSRKRSGSRLIQNIQCGPKIIGHRQN